MEESIIGSAINTKRSTDAEVNLAGFMEIQGASLPFVNFKPIASVLEAICSDLNGALKSIEDSFADFVSKNRGVSLSESLAGKHGVCFF